MAVTIGLEASVTWASSLFLIANMNVQGGRYTETADTHDGTPLGASTTGTMFTGLKAATASLTGRFPASAPKTGYAGNAIIADGSYGDSSGDVINLLGWSLDLVWPAVETTAKNNGAAVLWREFVADSYRASGVIRCRVDDTEALIGAASASDAAIASTLDIDGTNKFTGSLKLTGAGMTVQRGQANAVEFPFEFIGAVTAVGGSNLFAAAVLPRVLPQTLVVIAKTGRQYSGSAFPTRVGINVDIGSPIEVSVDAQFTGTVTPG